MTEPQLLRSIYDAASTITQTDCEGWYREVFRYYVECAARKPLVDLPRSK